MSRSLCLTRHCLGMITRIECEVRPLAGEQGLWTLLCAAGMAAGQPSMIKAQGPFCGPCVAEQVLDGPHAHHAFRLSCLITSNGTAQAASVFSRSSWVC